MQRAPPEPTQGNIGEIIKNVFVNFMIITSNQVNFDGSFFKNSVLLPKI